MPPARSCAISGLDRGDRAFLELCRTRDDTRDQRLRRGGHEKPIDHARKPIAPHEQPRPFQRCAVPDHLASEIPGKYPGKEIYIQPQSALNRAKIASCASPKRFIRSYAQITINCNGGGIAIEWQERRTCLNNEDSFSRGISGRRGPSLAQLSQLVAKTNIFLARMAREGA